MEQQRTILESLGDYNDSSNSVGSILSTPKPKTLCDCGCGERARYFIDVNSPNEKVFTAEHALKYALSKRK